MDIPSYCLALTGSSPYGVSNPAYYPFPNVLGEHWYVLIWLGLLGSALLLALVYMAGNFLRIPKLDAWAKFELFQVLATAALVLFIGAWVWGMCTWDVSFLDPARYQGAEGLATMAACGAHVNVNGVSGLRPDGQPTVTPYCVAQSYLQKVKARGDDIFQAMLALNYGLSYALRITWESRPVGIGYTIEPLAGLQQIQNIFLVGVSGFMLSYLSTLIQMRVLDYFLISMPFFFIPLGALLRCFAPTREFGGSVVGMGIASLLFFPLILTINDVALYKSFDTATRLAVDINDKLFGTTAVLFSCKSDGTDDTWMDLSKYSEGDVMSFPSNCNHAQSLPIRHILSQTSNQLVFESPDTRPGSSGGNTAYSLQRIGDHVDVYQVLRIVDPTLAETQLDSAASLYENQPYGAATKRYTIAPLTVNLDKIKEDNQIDFGSGIPLKVTHIIEQSTLWLIFREDDHSAAMSFYMVRSDQPDEWGVYTIDVKGKWVGTVSNNNIALDGLTQGDIVATSVGDLTVAEVLENDAAHAVFQDAKSPIYTFIDEGGTVNVYRASGLWPEKSGASVRMLEYFTTPRTGTNLPFSQPISWMVNFVLSVTGMAAVYIVMAIFLPIINFMVFIEIARTASMFLGAELDLTNLTRLI